MEAPGTMSLTLAILLTLHLHRHSVLLVWGAMDSCYDDDGRPSRCMPKFENAAFNRSVLVSNACGTPPEDYCMQTGSTRLCHRCDAADPEHSHGARLLTDFHTDQEPTWWQSQSMFYGVQHPNSVNITLHLGKAFEITYLRLKFYTSRPESFAIYKRLEQGGAWLPYQYYSGSCLKTYGRDAKGYLRPGEDERSPACTEEFSDISPLTGGNVAFSTLEGRPSAYNFDQSVVLQEFVTATDLLISLDRLNTFGDEFFKDSKVLRSYFYAISDFSVGGRCKCNGHASECVQDQSGVLACVCQHHTVGADCQQCHPFYQDRPWARATGEAAHECLKCDCSGRSEECLFDMEQYRSSGHGGRCLNCRDNTQGPHCERCTENHYRASPQDPCLPCDCNVDGSEHLQCDVGGGCVCRATVTGAKCDTCQVGFHSLGPTGCRPCGCDARGSVGHCSLENGECYCKPNVEGQACDRCKPGFFHLQQASPAGCQACFCFGHSLACSASTQVIQLENHFFSWKVLQLLRTFLCSVFSPNSIWLGSELLVWKYFNVIRCFSLPRLHEEEVFRPTVSSFRFRHLLHNLTAFKISNAGGHNYTSQLSGVRLASAAVPSSSSPSPLAPAPWVEVCSCPRGFAGRLCESCAPGFTRETPRGGPLAPCVPCTCHQHGPCHPETGTCDCSDFTAGTTCEQCLEGYYGNALIGTPGDCRPCPCPGRTSCAQITQTGEVVCTNCPAGRAGKKHNPSARLT
uniref:Laminin, gamma 3 n=1 Tax=Gadus morhua TaxID=8049 RepID=A0A8C5BJL7_GADMO